MRKTIFIILGILIVLGGIFLARSFLSDVKQAEAAPRNGLVLDLNFGDNDGGSAPIVYDSSGYNRHATSTAGSTSPSCGTKNCVFDTGDLMSFNASSVFNSSNLSIVIRFRPFFAWNDSAQHWFIDGPPNDLIAGTRTYIYKQASAQGNNLVVQLNSGSAINIAPSAYRPYWLINQDNTIVITGTSGNNNVWLNGSQILTGDVTVWSAGDITSMNIGDDYSGANLGLDGRFYFLKVYNRLLTSTEINNFFLNPETNQVSGPRGYGGAPRNGLIGYWTMDANDVNGTTYYDKSGYNNTATSTGSPTIRVGKIREAVSLNGSSQYLQAPSTPYNFGTGNFTASAWFNVNALGLTATIFDKWNTNSAGERGWILQSNNSTDNKVVGYLDSGAITITGTTAIVSGRWYHAVMVRNGANLYLYLNGVQDATVGGQGAANANSSRVLDIGAETNDTSFFNGFLDDLRIYNRALSASEVLALYNSAKIHYADNPSRAGLVGYWTMDNNDISGTIILGKSGYFSTSSIVGTTITRGKFNQAFSFDGTDDYVRVGLDGLPAVMSNATVSFWAKSVNNNAQNSVLLANGDDGTNNRFNIHFPWSNGILYWDFGTIDAPGRLSVTWNATWNDNLWAHWVFMSEAGVGQKIYRNNVLVASDSTAGTFTKGDKTLDIGKYLNTYWKGDLDDLRIYNRALSRQEVSNLYDASKVNFIR